MQANSARNHHDNTTTRRVAVAIIGTGYAGISAAIEAANYFLEHNPGDGGDEKKVLLVEKMSKPGVNSIMNAGQIAAVNSEQQKMAKIQDSVELMMSDMCKAGVDLNHPNLIRTMIAESNDAVLWTERELGVQYRDRVSQLGGHSVPRTLSTIHACGEDIIDPMLKRGHEKPNIEMALNTAFEEFIVENLPETTAGPSDAGRKKIRVEGIRTRNKLDDHVETVLCSHGVIWHLAALAQTLISGRFKTHHLMNTL